LDVVYSSRYCYAADGIILVFVLILLVSDCVFYSIMASTAATKDSTSQDVEMKDVEKTDNGEEVKKDPDLLTLEGMLSVSF